MKKNLKLRLAVISLLLFLPFVVAMVSAFITFANLSDDGVAINLSGSQRMRTMLIANYAQQYHAGIEHNEDISELKTLIGEEVSLYLKIEKALIYGDVDLKIGENKDRVIIEELNNISQAVTDYSEAAMNLINGEDITNNLQYISDNALTVKNEIDNVVSAYQDSNDTKIENFKYTLDGLLVFGIVIFILGYRSNRNSIYKPISMMATQMADIAKGDGDLTAQIQVKNQDVIGKLAIEFNRFVGSIRGIVIEISTTSDTVLEHVETLNIISEETGTATEKLASISTEIADGATEQADAATITAGNLSELGEEIVELDKLSKEVDGLATKTIDINNKSQKSVNELSEGNRKSYIETDNVGKAIEELYQKVKNISNITSTIEQLASQTNLLALNASIEAARAGEHGRGFAVVASEVSALADQSASSTSEIGKTVSEIITEIESLRVLKNTIMDISNVQTEAVTNTQEAAVDVDAAINEVLEKIGKMDQKMERLNVNKDKSIEAISNVAAVSEETAAATEETAAFTDEFQASMMDLQDNTKDMFKLAQNLKGIISKFKY